MTLQAKAFQWSVGIHGLFLLIFAWVQFSAVSPLKVTVIDFTLTDNKASSALEQPSPHQTPLLQQEPKQASAIRPEKIVQEHTAPLPTGEKAPAPADVPSAAAEPPTPVPQAVDGPDWPSPAGKTGAIPSPLAADGVGAPSANGARRTATDTNSPTPGAAGSSGDTGAGVTPEVSRAVYLKEHFVYIRNRITGSISYPPMARKMGWCGQVKIAFVVCEDGGVNDVRVVESSGFGMLDRNAVDTVNTVAPFPRPPVRAEIRMAITYRLN